MRPEESFIRQPVRSLQTMLRVIGEDAGKTLTVIPDGIFGTQTQKEVTEFQQAHGIPVTGVVDLVTWEQISAEFPDAYTRIGPAEPIHIPLDPGKVFRLGDRSYFIHLIQAMLFAMSEIYGSLSAPEITGYYDDITADSVSSFQRLSGLQETGETDKVTWKHLVLQYPLAVNRKETDHRIKK